MFNKFHTSTKVLTKTEPIYVAKPSLPDFDNFVSNLRGIWESGQLSNGPHQDELEKKLGDFLHLENVVAVNNGTSALLLALKSLDIKGEVITTPFTFAATTHAIRWCGLTPVFADINESDCNISTKAIEQSITKETSAILAVHCFGYPCAISKIKSISEKYDLKIIYDASHCFGVADSNGSIFRHGDVSTTSFHPTKVFNTMEGGAIFSGSTELVQKLRLLRNFGIQDQHSILWEGINCKLSECQSLFGILQLSQIKELISRRQQFYSLYTRLLEEVPGITLVQSTDPSYSSNGSYFPIRILPGFACSREELIEKLEAKNIYPRRYFYPLLSNANPYNNLPSSRVSSLPVANTIATEILCLPLHAELSVAQIQYICSIIIEAAK